MCLEENSITLGQCVYGCNGNDHCEEDCLYRTGSKLNHPIHSKRFFVLDRSDELGQSYGLGWWNPQKDSK